MGPGPALRAFRGDIRESGGRESGGVAKAGMERLQAAKPHNGVSRPPMRFRDGERPGRHHGCPPACLRSASGLIRACKPKPAKLSPRTPRCAWPTNSGCDPASRRLAAEAASISDYPLSRTARSWIPGDGLRRMFAHPADPCRRSLLSLPQRGSNPADPWRHRAARCATTSLLDGLRLPESRPTGNCGVALRS